VTVVVYIVSIIVRHGSEYHFMFEGVIANVALGSSAAICILRSAMIREGAVAFLALGLGGVMFTAGNVAYVSHVQYLGDQPPIPNLADIGYLGAYPFFVVAVVVLARAEVGRQQIGVWLDGVVGGLGLAAVGSALVLHTTLNDLTGDAVRLVFSAAPSVADILLLSMIVGVLTLRGRRPDRRWAFLAGGLAIFSVADIIYLLRRSTESYDQGSLLDALWVVGLAVLSLSAFQPARARMTARTSAGSLTVTIVFCLSAVAVLVAASEIEMPRYAIGLAAATLITGALRAAIAFRQIRNVAELRRQARTDELTGLLNSRAFTMDVDRAIARSPSAEHLAVLVVDVNQYNQLNELFGHDLGDRLLREIAPRLATVIRADHALSRLGAGEFALVLLGADPEAAAAVGRRICGALDTPFVLNGIAQKVSANVGIALCPSHSTDAQGLLKCADVAMRSAKAQRTLVEVYDPVHGAEGRDRLALAKQLRAAFDENQFVVHYQPKLDSRGGAVVGAEALVRWQHPDRGLLYPDAFLPLTEQIGCMNALTRVVLAAAVNQCTQWRLDGLDLAVAVNLSASDLLDETLVGHIATVLAGARLPPDALELEITETTLMVDPVAATETLGMISRLGVKLSVDDYGTGFSSLVYLRDLPVQELKIDRSFIIDLTPDSRSAAIVRSTIDLAHTLGLSVVAEGVENADSFALLRRFDCDLVQGYHFCRPRSADDLTRWLRAQHVGILDPTAAVTFRHAP
jgi:diguanylate cyclase (GGDEF)-like protein